jgi:SAM-dependent methyltransferase
VTTQAAGYFEHMYRALDERDVIWTALAEYIQPEIKRDATVLEIGAGYCSFINRIRAMRRIALDVNPASARSAGPGVEFVRGDCAVLEGIHDASVDVVFASNVFEHLDRAQFESSLANIHRVLRPGGKLIILQPNFYYAYRVYFHDYTHKTPFTHIGLSDALTLHGFDVVRCEPGFVPMSMQSKYGGLQMSGMPFLKQAVALYLRLPWKPLAKQMYLVARTRAS